MSKLDGSITDCGPQEYTLKEGSKTRLKVSFKVHNNVVLGLKVCSSVKTKIKLFKDEEVLGTFGPDSNLTQTGETDWETTPDGMFKRGKYEGKIYFSDVDGNIHLQYNFIINIKKDW